jgi:hypothetical protein
MKTMWTALVAAMASCCLQTAAAQEVSLFRFASSRSQDRVVSRPEVTTISYRELPDYFRRKKAAKVILGFTKQQRPIEAYYFPGTGSKKALVLGGMHGSELSAIEIAYQLLERFRLGEKTYYDILLLPILFPDNAITAASSPADKRKSNAGRYTSSEAPDPNRQMPCLGTPYREDEPFDHHGRSMEKEIRYLLQLIQEYRPSRIVNLHAIRDTTKAGIYADPRTDCRGMALGFETDSVLALGMARFISEKGGFVPGNKLSSLPSALYYHDPAIAPEGCWQPRNLQGSPLPLNRGFGVSLGGWATTAVCGEGEGVRDAIRLITVEFPGYAPSFSITDEERRKECAKNIAVYTEAVLRVFLSPLCEE